MGKIVKINPADIHPSQDFLKADTLAFIEENYNNGFFDKLPPTPIVRESPDGGYIAIDGHNLLAFYASLNIECEIYIAENKEDELIGDSEMISKRNKDLYEKYDIALIEADKLVERGIRSMRDLLSLANKHS